MQSADFDYDLPPGAIAQSAIEPRDAARLLVVDGLHDHRVSDLPRLLDPGDLLVVNSTRVRKARLVGAKPTGGTVELLLLSPLPDGRWRAMARPARRLRAGVTIFFSSGSAELVSDPHEGFVEVVFDGSVDDILETDGAVPLPPYFEGNLEDDDRYQTVYARRVGSAAAPTAGLHFTQRLLEDLAAAGVRIAEVELEVGLDTFRPLDDGPLDAHRMHTERVIVDSSVVRAIESTRSRGRRVVAVGTTVVRALESAAAGGSFQPFDGPTDLFIRPGYDFQVVDTLMTNFHVPNSTLLVMLEAFMGPAWRDVYSTALERGYRFLSFGDAMLVQR